MAWRLLIAAASIAMAADQPKDSYQSSILQWRAQREATLKADDGWLTVVGLYWLKPGENRVGSNASSEIPLPRTAPENAGVLVVKGGKVFFKPSGAGGVTINNSGTVSSGGEGGTGIEVSTPLFTGGIATLYVGTKPGGAR